MSSKTYFELQHQLHANIKSVASKEMEEAVKEETELAIKRGDVDINGIPCLTVVVDGAWAKRSYKSNYRSLSGVVS